MFSRITQHDSCNDWLEFVSSARYTSSEKTGVGASAHHSGQVMGKKMEWDGRVIEWAENDSIVWQAMSGTPEAMRMKAVNRVEKEGKGTRYFLEVEYMPPYSILGTTFNAEPEESPRTILGLSPRQNRIEVKLSGDYGLCA